MSVFIHDKAIVESKNIGDNTRIWAFTHILPGAVIGENNNICDQCFIENEVKTGNNVTVKCGVYLWDGIEIEDNVQIGPCCAFTNDKYPRAKNTSYTKLKTILKKGSSIGANATILPGLSIGEYAMVGAGSVVTKNVPDHALVYGNPAIIKGYVCICGKSLNLILNEYICDCGKKYIMSDNQVKLND